MTQQQQDARGLLIADDKVQAMHTFMEATDNFAINLFDWCNNHAENANTDPEDTGKCLMDCAESMGVEVKNTIHDFIEAIPH